MDDISLSSIQNCTENENYVTLKLSGPINQELLNELSKYG